MALKHREMPVYGIQFHPESILTEMGMRILENFLIDVAGIDIDNRKKEEDMTTMNQETLKPFLAKIVDGNHLTTEESYKAMDCIMSGNATEAQIASFLTGLRMNGETPDEITGFARVMRAKAAVVPEETEAIDIVGTGGDLANSFNISTTSSFVIAAAGAKVAKHGNRSVSSKSGAADVLEALGAKIGLSPEEGKQCLDDRSMAFWAAAITSSKLAPMAALAPPTFHINTSPATPLRLSNSFFGAEAQSSLATTVFTSIPSFFAFRMAIFTFILSPA